MKVLAVIKPNGKLSRVSVDDGSMLIALQTECGGYVQAIDLTDTLTMWCNEDGKLNGSDWNECATAIWHAINGPTDTIFGNVVFTGTADDEGETQGITSEDFARLEHVAAAYEQAMKAGFAGV